MGKSARVESTVLTICIVLCLYGWAAPASAGGPLVLNKETGHYKDLSYEALSDKGLSWEQRTRLFGGETVHYGELTAEQREAKQKQLDELLAKIDMKLVNRCEADIRKWLDERAKRPLKHADWRQDWSLFTRRSMWPLIFGSVTFFRAYEIFGDEKHLKAGLKRADVLLRDQAPRGNWRQNTANDGRYCRIQDKFQDGPFYVMLYAYKVSRDRKYLDSAKRCADLLLTLQRPASGGWGDQWLFDGARLVNSGVIHGMSHNDCATTSPFTMMVTMYHLTKDRKYVANLHKLGPWIARTDIGEGERVGWAEAYRDDGKPQRVRQYEIELVYPASITRSVGPLLIWLYLMDGNEAHMDLLKKAYAWFEEARLFDLKPANWKCWKIMMAAHRKASGSWKEVLHPGWAHAYLPDGSNYGWVTGYAMYPFYPVTKQQREKYGALIHRVEGNRGDLYKWAEDVQAGKPPVKTGLGNGTGNAMVQVRRALLEHKRGGHRGLLKYYTGPVKYTPDQYLQARVDAAKRALDKRNVRLAAMHEKGIRSRPDCAALVAPKGRWYGPKYTKWGHAYEDRILHPQYPGSTAWYQWQLVYDAMLAQGKIPADAAACGGRGMEQWVSSMSHLDSWDVLGPYDMHVHEVENHFDVPIRKTLASAPAPEEMYVVRDGKLIKEGLDWPDVGSAEHPFWKDWVHCAGTTVNGLYVVPKRVGNRNNHARFQLAKSALGDCEFKVVFSCPDGRGTAMPVVHIRDRGRLVFARDGSQIWMSLRKQSLPLKGFAARCEKNPYDGKLHSMGVKRVGDKISFYYDDKKINEQPIDPDTNLHIWFDALRVSPKIKSMKLTAEKLSDELTTRFKRAAPIQMIYKGSGAREKPEYGKACRYRIPALAVSTRGTILAFAEARRTGGGDIGDIDAVVRRSEDGGKTWGPEIVIWDDGERSVNNPSAVVDPKTGRIWVFMGRWDGTTPSQHVAYSDDDGKTWSKSREMTQILRAQIKDGRRLVIPGPGSGIALERGKYAGRLVIPINHGGAWGPSVVYSDDHGKTWKPGGALHANIGESKCAELCDGSVLFVGNPGPPETRRRLTVITEGGTKNATKLWHAEDLRHAGCQGAVERHSWPTGGKPGLLLYSGPAAPAARAQGTLRGSYDEGKTWPWTLEYYQGPSGYSDIAVLADGRVAVLFEKDGKSHLGFTILPAPPATPPGASSAAPTKAPPLVFDKKIGHYKDMSYEALSDEGLSWEERTRLFGGETVRYGELTAEQRKAKEKELQELLAKIDMKLVKRSEADIRKWLDERAARPLKNADWKKDWTMMTRRSMWPLSCGVATLLRAYEIFGDKKYLEAGLKRADVFLRDQTARGNWRKNSANDGRYCRIQDGNQHLPFFAVLHAYRVTGDRKYFESAKRCADLLLTLQRSSGGWPDQWLFDGAPKTNSGIIHGMSHNDNATISPFMMMVTMYHMTKDKKYIANLHKLGPFIAKTNLGEGDVVGWAEGYDDNGRPLRVRRYELELPYSKTLCRSVGFLLTWLYLMDGDEAHMDLLKRAYAWHEKVRQKELEPWQLQAWELMRKSHAKAGNPWFWYRPGFADAWLPDGSNWGYAIDWKVYVWYPATDAMIKKSGKYVGGASLIHPQAHVGHLKKWADAIRAGGSHPGFSRSFVQNSAGNTLSQVRRTLLEYKRGGRKGLLKYYTNPVKYTPDQYLQARVDAAKRALDARNVRLAAMHEKGIRTQADCGQLGGAKHRWYGPKHTKWGGAYEDVILREQYPGSTAWYQWQLVYDTMLAQGKVSAELAARGGRGMEASQTHLDSWDVLGPSDMHVFEVENHFDVPIRGK